MLRVRRDFALTVPWMLLGFGFLGSEPGPTLTRSPYVQLSTPDSIHIVWRTEGQIVPEVRFGQNMAHLDGVVSGPNIKARIGLGTNHTAALSRLGSSLQDLPRLHSAREGTFQYEAHLTGLMPATQYYYAVYNDKERLTPLDPGYHFITQPPVGSRKPVRIWVVGDSGTGDDHQADVYKAMLQVTSQQRLPVDLFLHVGDMAYTKGREHEFDKAFFNVYGPTLRNTVCWPAMGNHEGATSKGETGIGPYYDAYVIPTRGEAGGTASGMEAYYSFEHGQIHFICLDSHDLDRKPTGAMAKWLKADLEKTRADWLIAFWHHPPYTKGSHDSDKERQLREMRTHIMPILESAGVDLVLTGHSHIYERSMLIDGAYSTPTVAEGVVLDDGDGDPTGNGPYRKSVGLNPNEGAVQVVAGHGGAGLKRKGTMPIMRKIIVEHGSVLIDITEDTLIATMVNDKTEQRDLFSIVKRGRVHPQRVANPWQPPLWVPPPEPYREPQSTDPPEDAVPLIAENAVWDYLAGAHPQGSNWLAPGFKDPAWKQGKAGFGYGDDDDETVLADMRNNYSVVYVRHEFVLENLDQISEIGLRISYDDAFIAYLNGEEVLRKYVDSGSGPSAKGIRNHDSGRFSYYRIEDFEEHLLLGTNVFAVEGHNVSLESSDFSLHPTLIIGD